MLFSGEGRFLNGIDPFFVSLALADPDRKEKQDYEKDIIRNRII